LITEGHLKHWENLRIEKSALSLFLIQHRPKTSPEPDAEPVDSVLSRDFSVIRGSLPRRAMALVLEWAADHREELMEDWNLCSRMQTPKAIEPLK
jgi:hypothetical protein